MTQAIRLAVVLSAGGLRGAAHVGVLRQLVRHGVRIDAIVGVSAGAVIAGYYAAAGLDFADFIHDAAVFRGRHLLAYSLNVRCGYRFERRFASMCGVIPDRLRQLEAAQFETLHHGIRRLGIVCHDFRTKSPQYFSSGAERGVSVADAVRASASIPYLFPSVRVASGGREYDLTDGGISDPVPLAFARSPAIGATHVVVSDCRWIGRVAPTDPATAWIRPRMFDTGTLWSPARGLASAIRDGEAAVTRDVIDRILKWSAGSNVGERNAFQMVS